MERLSVPESQKTSVVVAGITGRNAASGQQGIEVRRLAPPALPLRPLEEATEQPPHEHEPPVSEEG